MTTLRNCRTLLILSLVALLVLAAAAHAAPIDRQERAPPGGKPVAPIAIDYTLVGELELGRPITAVVTVVPEQALLDAVVMLTASEAVVLGDVLERTELGDLAAGEEVELRVTLTPLALERLRLAVTVSGEMQGGLRQVRTISIPLRLGPVAPKTQAVLKLGADGEILHALPASRPPRGRLR